MTIESVKQSWSDHKITGYLLMQQKQVTARILLVYEQRNMIMINKADWSNINGCAACTHTLCTESGSELRLSWLLQCVQLIHKPILHHLPAVVMSYKARSTGQDQVNILMDQLELLRKSLNMLEAKWRYVRLIYYLIAKLICFMYQNMNVSIIPFPLDICINKLFLSLFTQFPSIRFSATKYPIFSFWFSTT